MPALSSSEIHIWRLRLTDTEVPANLLSADEQERAARFRFEKDRRAFQVCRSTLRQLLSEYVDQPANEITFRYGARGKPQVADETAVRFNVSHSREVALLAFALDLELGVDVESDRPLSDMADIARRFFCQEEYRQLMSLPQEERKRGFFRCWTRKEAYIKATGDGLHAPLDGFQVSLQDEDDARFIHINGSKHEASEWALHPIALDAGYTAALAYRGQRRCVVMKEFTRLNQQVPAGTD